ncbi:pyruvate, phosphate dikinase [Vagococcus xieshaowenii]|uniref:Pyruvate, phosphate dikinase n=1 Tax=Vagococcus xieshaowenii TaxID=2562451 RepID=A0A4Z0D4T2_9ENTE|nr:pyruvate, phosphate dikinase [Vagococcus xieshaowenii]QCA29404.1 pyruvate, phosphate dikinase [Vagococcus xieshaowenii]TFZ39303.1 pyruvate, phosphate dikinase [Vagococcus xieshaowenii]
MKKNIYSFAEGARQGKELLGGKGANLAKMTSLQLPVPQGFTITTACCMAYLEDETFFTTQLKNDILKAVNELENMTGQSFTQPHDLLLVSVRSGAAFSMPGMMDTILNLGLNDERVKLFAQSTTIAFAYDCYRRLIQMFGDVVYSIPKEVFNQALEKNEQRLNKPTRDWSETEHQTLIKTYQTIYEDHHVDFPQDPVEQLFAAIQAVFKSWLNPRAHVYRELHQIPDSLGTAVNIQAMVFGNKGMQSGTGVIFTRNPATGKKELFGEFLINAQGEDVVAGIRTPLPIHELNAILPDAYEAINYYAEKLEQHYQDMQDIEFTIEQGSLYILQTRHGKRTAKAAVQIVLDFVNEGMISKEEAVLRISPATIEQLLHPVFEPETLKEATVLAEGLPASPGAATGTIVFTAEKAKELHKQGINVILVRQETSPEDIEGMIVSQAIVTSRGGMTSHAAVVARGMGTCCVAGCEELNVNEELKQITCDTIKLTEGDRLSVDGSSGRLYIGELPTVFEENNQALQQLLSWADSFAHLKVRANAETPEELNVAINFGATGIGLARTEHMFFGEERLLEMRRLILSDSDDDLTQTLDTLLRFQQNDFYQMLKTIQDKPMVIRLLDPPLHEFLPHNPNDIINLAKQLNHRPEQLTKKINQLQETNPMLGHRGCRLGITEPLIYQMQVTAIFNSVIELAKEGVIIQPEIMIPLISDKEELLEIKRFLSETIQQVFDSHNIPPIPYQLGTMIELPRACLIADTLAEDADFFSFGTNDLTQMTYGFSRDDIGKFINSYQEKKIMTIDPFQTLDQEGVGQLIKIAVTKARQTKPNLVIGVCGEVGGDPASIKFFHQLGISYVSCSAYRVPTARLAAGQAALK